MRYRGNLTAWSFLGVVFAAMSVYLLLNPARTGVVSNYRLAATNWWASQSMYPGAHGFLYVPPFAPLFTPINLIRPLVLGEIVWRGLGLGVFSLALFLLSRLVSTTRSFLPIVLFAVPASLAALSNGQTNLPLSAALILAALAIRDQHWWVASGLLTLCLVLKPIALAAWLLALAVFPGIRIPLLTFLPALGLIGFFHSNPSYAWSQWSEFLAKLLRSYDPESIRVSDLFGMLERMGWSAPGSLEKGVRISGCLAALFWVWRSHRQNGVSRGAWSLWVASSLVLTVLNPRAETNSYVLSSPLIAFVAVNHLLLPGGNKLAGWILAAACIGLMCDGMGKPIYLATDVWFKPLLVIMVSPMLVRMPEAWAYGGRGSAGA